MSDGVEHDVEPAWICQEGGDVLEQDAWLWKVRHVTDQVRHVRKRLEPSCFEERDSRSGAVSFETSGGQVGTRGKWTGYSLSLSHRGLFYSRRQIRSADV